MLHLMKYRFLSISRDRTTMFWSFVFPLILCTLFYVSFGHIGTDMDRIDTGLVVRDDSVQSKALETTLKTIEEETEDFLSVREMEEEEALRLLNRREISGVYFAGEEPELMVAGIGIEESILQQILEEYNSQAAVIAKAGQENPGKLGQMLDKMMQGSRAYVEERSLGGEKVENLIQYFFALVAMTCLYGCYMGMEASVQLQANVCALGARRSVAAVGKQKSILADLIVVCLMSFLAVGVLLVYMAFGLKLQIGDQWGKMLFVSFVGCLIGVSAGILVGSIPRIGLGAKTGILTAFSLLSSALSGLMISGVKGMIEETVPLLNRINPASVITDAFYSVSIYPDDERFVRDVIILAVLSLVCMAGAFWQMRRVRYDSI